MMSHPGLAVIDDVRIALQAPANQRMHGYTLLGELCSTGRVIDRDGHSVKRDTLIVSTEFFIAPPVHLDSIAISSKHTAAATSLAKRCVRLGDGSSPFNSEPVITYGHARFSHENCVHGEYTETIYLPDDTVFGRVELPRIAIVLAAILYVCPSEQSGQRMFRQRKRTVDAESISFQPSW